MMKVRTQFDRLRVFSPSPTGVAKIYEERLNKDGVMDLVQTGEHDLNEFVQASLESTKVYNILEHFAKTQDPSIFNAVSGFFADVTGMPTDMMAAHNMLLSIDKKFASLPQEVKEKYNFSPYQFYEAVMNGTFASDFGQIDQNIVNGTDPIAAGSDGKVVENE